MSLCLALNTNSWYDRIWRDLSQRRMLQHHGDGRTYRVKRMASEQGRQFVQEHFEEYSDMMLDAMAPGAFAGGVASNGTHVLLSWADACPSVRVLRVRPAA